MRHPIGRAWTGALVALLVAMSPVTPTRASPPPGQLVVSADGTMVSDTRSGLVWQRGVDASSYSQSSAAAFCAARTLGGRSDWRLPTKAELQSIVDESRVNPAIDPTAFPATPSSSFWTATADVTQPGYGWFVDFGTGRVQSFATSTAYRVRCVR